MNRRMLIAQTLCLPVVLMIPRLAMAETVLDPHAETERLRTVLSRTLGPRFLEGSSSAWSSHAHRMAGEHAAVLPAPALVLAVDRNPHVQEIMVMLAVETGDWPVIGGCKVSAGRPGGRDHFKTPLGAFRNSSEILGFRAQGTKNGNGIRGYGERGMRIWDFGWQDAEHANGQITPGGMRLCMHATDPDRLEVRLGTTASQGCIRLPASMNRFLDFNGVIDRDYEDAARTDRRFASLLRPDRTPSPLAGNHLIVFES